MTTRASSLIPSETFRYWVKFLALNKAQTKVLPLPCHLLAAEEATGAARAASPEPPSPGGWSTAELFLDLPMGSRGGGAKPQTTWKDPRASKKALYVSLSLLGEGMDPAEARLRELLPSLPVWPDEGAAAWLGGGGQDQRTVSSTWARGCEGRRIQGSVYRQRLRLELPIPPHPRYSKATQLTHNT